MGSLRHNPHVRPVPHDVECPDCRSRMVLRWHSGHERWFYGCSRYPACNGYHSARGDGQPLGIPAPQSVRDARKRAHAAMGRLFHRVAPHRKRDARERVYRWLAEQMEMSRYDCHVSRFDQGLCECVVAICHRASERDVLGDLATDTSDDRRQQVNREKNRNRKVTKRRRLRSRRRRSTRY